MGLHSVYRISGNYILGPHWPSTLVFELMGGGGGGGGGGGEGRAAAIYDISRYFIFIAIRDISRYFLSYRDTNVHGNRRSSTGIDRNIQEVIY